jgi:hypothetical protein
MKLIISCLFLALIVVTPAAAETISWGSATASADNASFLNGASATFVGNTFTLNLLNFMTTSQFGFPPNEVDISTSAAVSGASFTGVQYSFFGTFTGSGAADFSQMANALSNTGTFSTSVRTGTINFGPTTSVNLQTRLNLNDGGDTAAITRVQLTLITNASAVPEPSSWILLGAGMALLAHARRRGAVVAKAFRAGR